MSAVPGRGFLVYEMEAGEVAPSRAGSKFLKKEGGGRAKVYSGVRIGSPRVCGGFYWLLARYCTVTTILLAWRGL